MVDVHQEDAKRGTLGLQVRQQLVEGLPHRESIGQLRQRIGARRGGGMLLAFDQPLGLPVAPQDEQVGQRRDEDE